MQSKTLWCDGIESAIVRLSGMSPSPSINRLMTPPSIDTCDESQSWFRRFDRGMVKWLDWNANWFEQRALWILAFYFLFHVFLRSMLPFPIGYDESEQFIVTQEWALGYNNQPPLFNWLQSIAFGLFGVGTFALIVVKQAILFAIFFTVYQLWRVMGVAPKFAAAGAFSLLMVSEIGWEMQRTRTHLTLALLLAAMFAWLFFSFLASEKGSSRSRRYSVAIGVVSGLGMLAKYNFFLLPLGLCAAVMIHPAFRARIMDRWVLLAIAMAVLVFAPHAVWMTQNPDLLAYETSAKFGFVATGSESSRVLSTIGEFGYSLFLFYLMPLLLMAIWYCDWRDWRGWPHLRNDRFRRFDNEVTERIQLLVLGSGIAVLAVFMIAVITGMTHVKSRWLVPAGFLVVAPMLFYSRMLVATFSRRTFWFTMLFLLLLGTGAIIKETSEVSPGKLEGIPSLTSQFWDQFHQLDRPVVVIDDQQVAALFRLRCPEVRIIMPGYELVDFEAEDPVFLFCETNEGQVPSKLAKFVSNSLHRNTGVSRDLGQSPLGSSETWQWIETGPSNVASEVPDGIRLR